MFYLLAFSIISRINRKSYCFYELNISLIIYRGNSIYFLMHNVNAHAYYSLILYINLLKALKIDSLFIVITENLILCLNFNY